MRIVEISLTCKRAGSSVTTDVLSVHLAGMLNIPDIAESLVRENPDIATAIVAGMAKDSAKLVEEYPDIAVTMVARTLTGNVKDPAKLVTGFAAYAAKAIVAEMLKDPAKLVKENVDLAGKLVAAAAPNLVTEAKRLESERLFGSDFSRCFWFIIMTLYSYADLRSIVLPFIELANLKALRAKQFADWESADWARICADMLIGALLGAYIYIFIVLVFRCVRSSMTVTHRTWFKFVHSGAAAMMMILLLFLQKQNLAFAVYLQNLAFAVYLLGSLLSLPD